MIRVDGQSYCIDPAGGIAEALGKKWTLPLIGLLGNRPTSRFRDLMDGLDGVGAKALTDRLRDLQGLGVVDRAAVPEIPAGVEYRLTEKGETLRRAIVPLLAWAEREERPARSR